MNKLLNKSLGIQDMSQIFRLSINGPQKGLLFRTALVLLIAALQPGCGSKNNETAEAPPPGVLVAKVANRQISETVEYVGRTVAVNDASLQPQVSGYLLERKFTEGDDIEAGAELFLIDPATYEAAVAVAEGKVAEVKAELARINKDLERYKILIVDNNISQQAVDQAESDKLRAEASLKSAEAQLLNAKIDLSHTVIRAPFTGRIGSSAVSVGDLVNPQGGELARLVELNPIYANFNISERDIIAVKNRARAKGKEVDPSKVEVTLRLPDGSVYDHIGRLDFVDNTVDRRTGTVILRARFENPDMLLVPGLYVSTILGREESEDRLVIPQSSVQEDQAGTFVMVVGPGNEVELRRIETGRAYAGELVVESGLNPDELVIVEGIQKVRPGIVVDPKVAPTPSMEGDLDADADSSVEAGER